MSKVHGSTSDIEDIQELGNLIICYTLIDITKTGMVSNYKPGLPTFVDDAGQIINDADSWTKSRNQQRNFETIVQTIGLRAQPIFLDTPVDEEVVLSNYQFGEKFNGRHNVWKFKFSVEHLDVFTKNGTELLALIEDLNFVPCIVNLLETVKINNPVFQTFDHYKNIYLDILQ